MDDAVVRVVVINGATREEGNTDRILQSVCDGAADAGALTTTLTLRNRDTANCIGCCRCEREGVCHFDDDMTAAREALEAADLIVFASPIYWCEVTGLMKTFIDRLYFYHHERNAGLVRGKHALVLATLGEENVFYETEVLVSFYNRLLFSLGFELADMEFFPGLMEKDAVLDAPGYLDDAYELGGKLPSFVA